MMANAGNSIVVPEDEALRPVRSTSKSGHALSISAVMKELATIW